MEKSAEERCTLLKLSFCWFTHGAAHWEPKLRHQDLALWVTLFIFVSAAKELHRVLAVWRLPASHRWGSPDRIAAKLVWWLYSDKRHRSNAATCLEKIQVINGLNVDSMGWKMLNHIERHLNIKSVCDTMKDWKKQTVPTRRLLIAMPGHQHRREACRHLSGWIVWRFLASTFCSINNKSIYNKVYIQDRKSVV